MTEEKEIDKAVKLIYELIELNQNIDSRIWVSAFFSAIASIHKINKLTYKEFLYNMKIACENYKFLWKNE